MITINIPTVKDFWKAITIFAYRRWYDPSKNQNMPIGIPGIRDPSSPCSGFAPIPKKFAGESWGDCKTDGHYMCNECVHKIKVDSNDVTK